MLPVAVHTPLVWRRMVERTGRRTRIQRERYDASVCVTPRDLFRQDDISLRDTFSVIYLRVQFLFWAKIYETHQFTLRVQCCRAQTLSLARYRRVVHRLKVNCPTRGTTARSEDYPGVTIRACGEESGEEELGEVKVAEDVLSGWSTKAQMRLKVPIIRRLTVPH